VTSNQYQRVRTILPTFAFGIQNILTILIIMGKAIELNDSNFEQFVNSEKPVLVDFWAEWCGPCKMIGPVVEELAGDYEGKATVGKLNVDENPAMTAKFGVRSIPTLLVFKKGQVVDKQIGAVPKAVLSQKLEAQLA
jgi:thioredoxin 1